MIIASAIKLTNGEVYVGKRHCDCFRNLVEINRKTDLYSEEELMRLHLNCEQGFITDSIKFLNREQAYYEAYECCQCELQDAGPRGESLGIKHPNWHPTLMSEDLW